MFSSKRCLEWFYEYAGEHLLDTLSFIAFDLFSVHTWEIAAIDICLL